MTAYCPVWQAVKKIESVYLDPASTITAVPVCFSHDFIHLVYYLFLISLMTAQLQRLRAIFSCDQQNILFRPVKKSRFIVSYWPGSVSFAFTLH